MKIDSVFIESFGRFKNFRMDFHEGMNIIYGDNEAGKSTIMAFIEMMFYGRTAQEKSTDISKSLRKKYTPWDGTPMCGELEFTYGGRQYRIRKVFKKTIKTDEVKLYDAQTGGEIALGRDEEIGHRFFGIDVGSFEKSVYISGFGGFAGTGQTSEDMAVKLSNLVTTMDEDVSQSKVLGRLTKAKELLLSKSGSRGRLAELSEESRKVKEELLRTGELVQQQMQYVERRSRLEGELEECQRVREELKKAAKRNELIKERSDAFAEKDMLRKKREQYEGLLDEAAGLERQRESFSGANYNYDTALEYINRADELRHAVYSKKSQADELQDRQSDGVVIAKEEVARARALEASRVKLMGLSERISEFYGPALEEKRAAKKAESDGLRLLEGIGKVPRSRIFISAASMLVAVVFVVLAFAVSMFMLAGAVIFAGIGAAGFAAYKKQCDEHARQLENAKSIVEKLAQERAVKNNNFEREKGRLFDKGAGLYPDVNCDFETITREGLIQCQKSLEEIYERYGVPSLEALEELSAMNEEAAVNRRMFEAALKELNSARDEYDGFVGDDDPENVRISYNGLKEKLAVLEGKLKMQGIEGVQPENELKRRISELDKQLEMIDKSIDELTQAVEGCMVRTGEQSTQQLDSAIAENDARAEDIRGQLLELAALLQSPEHDEEELKRVYAELTKEYNEKKELYDALVLAEKNMQAAVDDISSSFGPVLNGKTADIFGRLTGGKYEKVMVDKEYSIQAKQRDGGYHDWRFLSNGTTDQAYLALRLAMTQLITENSEKLPLMLDDILLQYDSTRAGNAFSYLKEYAKEVQILFFTCREMEIPGYCIQVGNFGTEITV